MAKTSKVYGILKSLLAAMLVVFAAYSPASSAMSMRCDVQHVAVDHYASVLTAHSVNRDHGHPVGQDTCCKSNCVDCAAVLAPCAFDIPIEARVRESSGVPIFLVGVTSPPLLGPPRSIASTF